jgi:hypothetical protein
LHVDVALQEQVIVTASANNPPWEPAKLFAIVNVESGEEVMSSSRPLRVFGSAPSQPLSAAAVDQLVCSGAVPTRMIRAATFKAEVLLDRLDISPGIIGGKTGENVGKAIAAFQRSPGLAASGELDRTTSDKLCEPQTRRP